MFVKKAEEAFDGQFQDVLDIGVHMYDMLQRKIILFYTDYFVLQ